MEQIVIMSEKPFQYVGFITLSLAMMLMFRILLDQILPFTVLSEVTNGLLLNAIAVSALVHLGVLCVVGEFSIRTFVSGRRVPAYIVREVLRRAPGSDTEKA